MKKDHTLPSQLCKSWPFPDLFKSTNSKRKTLSILTLSSAYVLFLEFSSVSVTQICQNAAKCEIILCKLDMATFPAKFNIINDINIWLQNTSDQEHEAKYILCICNLLSFTPITHVTGIQQQCFTEPTHKHK